jgi:hypothetical protein
MKISHPILMPMPSSDMTRAQDILVFSNSKESSGKPIIGLSSPKENETPQKEVFLKPLVVFCDSALLCYNVPIIWNQPKQFEDHIIMIGTFHVVCAYFKMIGKKMEGTGLSDILLEAGLIGSGSERRKLLVLTALVSCRMSQM